MKNTWLCFGSKDMGSREGLSITMEIVCSPQVISQKPKDLKFPLGMHFCKSRSQGGHLIVRLLQWCDKLPLFPSVNERQPSEWQIQTEIISFIQRRFYTLYCHFLSDLYSISKYIQAFIFRLQTVGWCFVLFCFV